MVVSPSHRGGEVDGGGCDGSSIAGVGCAAGLMAMVSAILLALDRIGGGLSFSSVEPLALECGIAGCRDCNLAFAAADRAADPAASELLGGILMRGGPLT